MTTTTPVPVPEPEGLPTINYGQGSDTSVSRAMLAINNEKRPGTWDYLGMTIERPSVLFITTQDIRKYYRYEYNDKPKDLKENPISCSSWNGKDAFGHGDRAPTAGVAPRLRDCELCPHSEYHKERRKEWCPPIHLMFGMVVHQDSDVWSPFFFEASGMKASPTINAYRLAMRYSQTSLKKQPNGGVASTRPVYTFAFTPKVEKIQGANGYTVDWGKPTGVPEPDLAWVTEFLRSQGKEMWEREIARRKQDSLTMGARVPAPGAAEAEETTSEGIGEVPF